MAIKAEPFEINRLALPRFHYDYLLRLARAGRLGISVNDVAAFLLIKATNEMFRADYLGKQNPY